MNRWSNGQGRDSSVVVDSEIYLDAAAASPPSDAVLAAMQQVQQHAWANPSSLHGHGLAAAEVLERCRWQIATRFGVQPDQLTITSGATESVHLALLGTAARLQPGRLVISAVEHPAVAAAAQQLQRLGWQLEHWPVDRRGVIQLDAIDRMLSPPTRLVSIGAAQGEVGSLQPLPTVAAICRQRGVILHSDATQLVPQGLFDFNRLGVDLLSLSAHKCQGPRGVGLLIRNREIDLAALLGGGGQEDGNRSGTEPVALVAGMATALANLPDYDPSQQLLPPGSVPRLRQQRDTLLAALLNCPHVQLLGADLEHRLPHHIALLVGRGADDPVAGRTLVRRLADVGIACSSGSACSSGQSSDSAVLTAMDVPKDWRQSGLRLSLGPWLTDEQLDQVPKRFNAVLRSIA